MAVNRRLASLAVALAVLAGGALSGCSTFNRNDAVAVVNGNELSRDTFNSWMSTKLVQNPELQPGTALASSGHEFVTYWALSQLLAPLASGLDTTTLNDDLTTRYGERWTTAPETFRMAYLAFQSLNTAAQNGQLDRAKITELLDGDVWIDPRLGVWDTSQGAIVGHTGR